MPLKPAEFKQLYRKRAIIEQRLNTFAKFIDSIKTSIDLSDDIISELELNVQRAENIFAEFDELQMLIELNCNDNIMQEEYAQREKIESSFSKKMAVAKTILKKRSKDSDSVGSSTGAVPCRQNYSGLEGVKLPPIKLPIFGGDYLKWIEFKDTFDALIHDNKSLTDIQKYHYLRASLTNEALKIIQSLDFSAQNYNNAWQTLCDRFSNSRMLVNNHMKALFDLDNLNKESATGLRNLIDNVKKHLCALKTLKLPTESWDAIVIHLISIKLDKTSSLEWEKVKCDKSLPDLNEFFDFLKKRANFLETIELNGWSNNSGINQAKDSKDKKYSKSLLVHDEIKYRCNLCKQNHLIYTCEKFLKMSVAQRWETIKGLKLCSNCLCTGHFSYKCQKMGCKICRAKHSALLHENKVGGRNNSYINTNESATRSDEGVNILLSSENLNDISNSQKPSLALANNSYFGNDYVLLSTAKVKVYDKTGKSYIARVLLDSGSQSCFISEEFLNILDVDTKAADICVTGINNSLSSLKRKCQVTISSRFNDFSSVINCLVVPKITDNLPAYTFEVSHLRIPENVLLADDSFCVNGKIDMLLDASLLWSVLSEGRIDLGRNSLSLQNTALGYIVTGKLSYPINNKVKCHFSEQPLQQFNNDELQKFWAMEEPNFSNLNSSEDIFCEEHYENSMSRALNGQFIVKIPWREDPSSLGDSKHLAIKRLLNLEARFKRNLDLKKSYTAFINEYKDLGHMSLNFDLNLEKPSYFLPHHGIIRNESLTTKLRVVFDGSAPSSNGKSLNNIQYPGPAIQNDIVSILLRFREHKVVVVSDISKMYRIVLMHPDDRDMQQILWRNDPSEPIQTYRLNTVTYGTASAPFLAMRCIQQLSFDNKENYPEAAEIILRDFYVDDLITGFPNETDAIKTCDQIVKILNSACFDLRKWTSNSQEVLTHFKDDSDSLKVLTLGDNESIKTLGVQWSSRSDIFSFQVKNSNVSSVVTKRSMLSAIAKIYDPLGLVSCCIILVKIMIQLLWSLKLDWDSEIPSEMGAKWRQFQSKLPSLNDLRIPRFVLCDNPVVIELHGFSDASKHAYCAAVYVKCVDSDGHITVKLLCAKTKVAPVKMLTIPRLELCGSLLLVQLMKKILNSVIFPFESYYWCDSQIVLHWLNSNPANLQVFVGNRVAEIQRSSNIDNWNYVNTKENPADIGSRGILPDQLKHCQTWFNGPSFLSTNFKKPKFLDLPPISEIPEIKQNAKVFTSVKNDLCSIFNKFSSLNKLVRVVAYCRRFIHNLKSGVEFKIVGPITATEFNLAELFVVKLSQEESFSPELSLLKGNKSIPSSNRLLSLTPFLDDNGLLRVGGRLKKSSLNYEGKHPLLLDKTHNLSKLILRHEHLQLQHAGPQLLLASVRQRFWIVSGMSLAKMIVKSCMKCYHFKPKPMQSIMADLPESRVKISPPFHITGLDYAGPFVLKDRKGRGCKTYKAYICLFICFSTKAVHLELISSLTSEAFLAGLRRFVSRRGKPAHLYSDNGSNFVGAKNELKLLYDFLKDSQDEIVSACASQIITWHFIPPSTPNFGGLWESNIKGVKYHFYRVIGETILTYEEFITLLIQIEATLNSRPLYALSSDPNDFIPLTPSHFLIGRPLNTVPDPSFKEGTRINQLSRLQLIQQLLHGFWKQWSKLYLSQLQQRCKWKTSQPMDIQIGILVLIKNDNLPPCKWLLGRIIAIHPGDDNVVRVVTIKTANATFKRGITKICPLPMAESVF